MEFSTLVTPILLSQYTWTGKGKEGIRKHSFAKYKQILKVIYDAVRAGDKRYTLARCKMDLIQGDNRYPIIEKEMK